MTSFRRLTTVSSNAMLVGLIFALAAALRIYHLDYQSFWLDEALSADFTAQAPLGRFFELLRADVHPPLYYIFLKLWMSIFGGSDFSVRSLSALFSLLALIPLGLLVRRAFDQRAALAAMLLCACSSYQIWYAQEARAYALLVLLGACATLAFARMLSCNSRGSRLLYSLSAAALLYTHYVAALLIAAHFVALLFHLHRTRSRDTLINCLSAFALAGLLFIPWLPFFLEHIGRVGEGFWTTAPRLLDLCALFFKFLSHEAYSQRFFAPLLGALLAALCCVALWCKAADPFQRTLRILLCLALFVPPLMGAAISQISSSVWIPRVFAPSSWALCALLGGVLAQIPFAAVRLIALVLGLYLCTLSYKPIYLKPAKEQWKIAAPALSEKVRQGDGIIFEDSGVAVAFWRYYPHGARPALESLTTPQSARIWVVHALSRKKRRDIIAALEAHGYAYIGTQRYLALNVYSFQRPG